MEEIESAREKFLKTIKTANGYNENYEFSENERITKENADEYRRQLRAEKTRIKIPKSKPIHKSKKFTGKNIAALAASGILVVGGVIAINQYGEYKEQNTPIGLATALTQKGERPETLGISYDNVENMERIKDIIEDPAITDQEAKRMLPRIHSEYIDIIENKVSNASGVKKENVKLYSDYIDLKNEGLKTKQTVKIFNEYGNSQYYTSSDIFDVKFKNNISEELANAIKDVEEIKDIIKEIQENKDNFDKSSIVKKENDIMKRLSQFAAMKIEKDDRNNFIAKVTRKKDLNKVTTTKDNTNTKQNLQTDDEPEL